MVIMQILTYHRQTHLGKEEGGAKGIQDDLQKHTTDSQRKKKEHTRKLWNT